MTEEEWLECSDPAAMLRFCQGKISNRQLVLFGVACCRRIWHLLPDERSSHAVEIAVRSLDSAVPGAEVVKALMAAEAASEQFVGADDVDPGLLAATVAQDIAWAVVQRDVPNGFISGLA